MSLELSVCQKWVQYLPVFLRISRFFQKTVAIQSRILKVTEYKSIPQISIPNTKTLSQSRPKEDQIQLIIQTKPLTQNGKTNMKTSRGKRHWERQIPDGVPRPLNISPKSHHIILVTNRAVMKYTNPFSMPIHHLQPIISSPES